MKDGLKSIVGGAPLPRIDEEATALLVACTNLLTSMQLQGKALPARLVADLQAFSRNAIGFQVPFPALAAHALTKPVDMPELEWVAAMLNELGEHGTLAAKCVSANSIEQALGELGQIELLLERVSQMFGWTRSVLKLQARVTFDQDHPGGITKH